TILNDLVAQHREELLRLQGIFRVPGADELDAGP
ncbi:MAG: MarR family transcriptional regulator, partial [Hydrogenophilales bacterium 12-63-5]